MKKLLLASAVVCSLIHFSVYAQDVNSSSVRSYFKLTTSNGLIVAVYNSAENRIDYVYPHIFANYDSAKYVHPFTGNIKPEGNWKPVDAGYMKNTHVIVVKYENFTIYYFSSFTRNDKVFYAVIRGTKPAIEQLSFQAQTDSGTPVHGLTLLENPLEDLPCIISGKAYSGSLLKQYNDNLYEKYILYSFTDSLHTDSTLIPRTLADLARSAVSLVDEEVACMQNVFSSCRIPPQLNRQERDVVEQSVSILKMSQVSDKEIFPFSHGQILASLRPGLWHIAWVRDASYALQAMTRLGMYAEAKKGLEFMLKAPANRFKHYIYSDGKDYGPGIDYQISLTRYFGNGKEECDFNEFGPNIEYDDFGFFLIAFSDYVSRSGDVDFLREWQTVVSEKVADVIVHCIDTNSLIKADSGPWEHHLQTVKQYTFTSGVCARGLEQYAQILEQSGYPCKNFTIAADRIKRAILKNMLYDNRLLKGNAGDQSETDHEFYDAGAYEVFANGLFKDKSLFLSHVKEYDKVLRIKGPRPGYIRLSSADPYENQEWVFINLRIALAHLLFGSDDVAGEMINHVTRQATMNFNTIPEMYSNKLQMEKVPADFKSFNIWCNCIRETDDSYIGTIPMVGYGSGVYILSLFEYYEKLYPAKKL